MRDCINKTLSILLAGILITIFSCGQTNSQEAHLTRINTIPLTTKEVAEMHATEYKTDYIVFGRFCGECHGECATMYQYDLLNNKLFADHGDSYWEYKNGSPMKFATTVSDAKALAAAKELADNLPDFIVTAEKEAQRFGCPDCTDGCGYFFEIKKDNSVHKFYIDNPEKLEGDVKAFAEYLQEVLNKM